MIITRCLFLSEYHVIYCSYPNVPLSKIELYYSDPYDRAKEILKVRHRALFGVGVTFTILWVFLIYNICNWRVTVLGHQCIILYWTQWECLALLPILTSGHLRNWNKCFSFHPKRHFPHTLDHNYKRETTIKMITGHLQMKTRTVITFSIDSIRF